jgi:hypothetical protein
MNEVSRGYVIFLFTVLMMVVGVAAAYQVVDQAIVRPITLTQAYPAQGLLNITSQSSVEMYFSTASHLSFRSSAPVDVYIYVTNPSNYEGIYESFNQSVTSFSQNIPSTGSAYIMIVNTANQTAYVNYTVAL